MSVISLDLTRRAYIRPTPEDRRITLRLRGFVALHGRDGDMNDAGAMIAGVVRRAFRPRRLHRDLLALRGLPEEDRERILSEGTAR